jgi:hypothetical protein
VDEEWMMKESRQEKTLWRVVTTLFAAVGSGSIALYSLLTIAAFNSVNQNNFAVNYKTESIGTSYFDGGSGTATNAYKISTAQHLRNLQELNALGFFNSGTYFALENDITWDDTTKPLLPIGSDDQPFDGTFDGCGHTVTNMIVDGSNTWDIGMFGYVSITGVLKNLFLDHPIVNVTSQNGGGTADTTNPLSTYFRSAAQQLPTPAAKGSSSGLTWTNNTAGNSSTITGTQSTVSAAIDGKTVTYTVDWQSSDTALLSPSGTNWVTHATATDDNPTVNLHPVMLTARIYGIVNGRVMPYTLERYEINVLGNGLITEETTTITAGETSATALTGIFKTLWPLDAAGASADYHGTNVGFFAGHMDGNASYLGLVGGNSYSTSSNGVLIISGRVAKSTSCLVGKTRDDDVRAGSGTKKYGHTFDFTVEPETAWDSYETGPRYYHSTYYPDYYLMYKDFGSTGSGYGTIRESNLFTNNYLSAADADAYNYMRNYPNVYHGTASSTGQNSIDYIVDNDDGTQSTVTPANTIQFKDPILGASCTRYNTTGFSAKSGGTSSDEESWITGSSFDSANYRVNPNVVGAYCISNGFWIYTKGDSSDAFNILTGQSEFTLTFNITYFAKTSDGSTNTSNSWQILYNAWNASGNSIRSWQPVEGADSSSSSNGYWYKMSTLQNCLWYDLANPYQAVDKKDASSREHYWEYDPIVYGQNEERQYDPVTIIADGHRHTAHVKVTVKQGSGGSFLGAYYGAKASTDIWYPCFGIGMGQSGTWNCNYIHRYGTAATSYNAPVYGTSNVNPYIDVWDQPYLNTDHNTGYYSDSVMKSQRGPTTSTTYWSSEDNDFYNSYFGLSGNITMNILSFQSVFTNANGNVSDLLSNVDYIYSKSACTYDSASDTFTAWNTNSDVKVGLNVSDNLASGNAAYYFYRSSGSNPIVGVSYNNSAYKPTNNADYKEATLTAI